MMIVYLVLDGIHARSSWFGSLMSGIPPAMHAAVIRWEPLRAVCTLILLPPIANLFFVLSFHFTQAFRYHRRISYVALAAYTISVIVIPIVGVVEVIIVVSSLGNLSK